MKQLLFSLITAALLFSCTTGKHHVYPGNYNKYTYHGYKLRQQIDSLYRADTTGKGLVVLVNGKPMLIYK
jgi:hypothetical protein